MIGRRHANKHLKKFINTITEDRTMGSQRKEILINQLLKHETLATNLKQDDFPAAITRLLKSGHQVNPNIADDDVSIYVTYPILNEFGKVEKFREFEITGKDIQQNNRLFNEIGYAKVSRVKYKNGNRLQLITPNNVQELGDLKYPTYTFNKGAHNKVNIKHAIPKNMAQTTQRAINQVTLAKTPNGSVKVKIQQYLDYAQQRPEILKRLQIFRDRKEVERTFNAVKKFSRLGLRLGGKVSSTLAIADGILTAGELAYSIYKKYRNNNNQGGNQGGASHLDQSSLSALSEIFQSSQQQQDFYQALKEHNLIDSFNSANPTNKMVNIGPYRQNVDNINIKNSDIGGVAVEIVGLKNMNNNVYFDNFNSVLCQTRYSQKAFTDDELQIIMRELAIGIYLKDLLPLVSIELKDNNLSVVEDFYYKHTLVGDTILKLDYYLKSFLNGGVVPKDIIDTYYKNKSQNYKSRIKSIKSIFARETANSDKKIPYYTLQHLCLIHGIKLKNSGNNNVSNIASITSENFSISFRIKAKMRQVYSHEHMLKFIPDIEIEYTIEPNEKYNEFLKKFRSENNGEDPEEFIKLLAAHKEEAELIKTTMPQLPECKQYMAKLEVITSLCYLYSYLKNNNRVPNLLPINVEQQYLVVPQVPPIPLQDLAVSLEGVASKLRNNQAKNIFDNLVKTDPVNLQPENVPACVFQAAKLYSQEISDVPLEDSAIKHMCCSLISNYHNDFYSVLKPVTDRILAEERVNKAAELRALENERVRLIRDNDVHYDEQFRLITNAENQITQRENQITQRENQINIDVRRYRRAGMVVTNENEIRNNIRESRMNIRNSRNNCRSERVRMNNAKTQSINSINNQINNSINQVNTRYANTEAQKTSRKLAAPSRNLDILGNNRNDNNRTLKDSLIISGGCSINLQPQQVVMLANENNQELYDLSSNLSSNSYKIVNHKEKNYIAFSVKNSKYYAENRGDYYWLLDSLKHDNMEYMQNNEISLACFMLFGLQNETQDYLASINNDVDMNKVDKNGQTLLHYIARLDNVELFRYIKAIPNMSLSLAKDIYGNTPLHVAASNNNSKILQEFLTISEFRQKINEKNIAGSSLLQMAGLAKKNQINPKNDAFRVLQQAGANMNNFIPIVPNVTTSNTSSNNNVAMAIDANATNIAAANNDTITLDTTLMTKLNDWQQAKPIVTSAAASGNLGIIQLWKTFSSRAADYNNYLLHAAVTAARYGQLAALEKCFNNFVENNLNKVLMAALKSGSLDCINQIIMRSDPDLIVDQEQNRAVHIAALQNNVAVLNLLQQLGANFYLPNSKQYTCFTYAALKNKSEALEFLINNYVKPETCDKPTGLAVHCAKYNNSDGLKRVIAANSSLATSDYNNTNPLQAACENNAIDCLDILLTKEVLSSSEALNLSIKNDNLLLFKLINKPSGSALSTIIGHAINHNSYNIVQFLINENHNFRINQTSQDNLMHNILQRRTNNLIRNIEVAVTNNDSRLFAETIRSFSSMGSMPICYYQLPWLGHQFPSISLLQILIDANRESLYQILLDNYGLVNFVKILDINLQHNLLHLAAASGNSWILSKLFDKARSASARQRFKLLCSNRDVNGHNPLTLAAANGHVNILRILKDNLFANYQMQRIMSDYITIDKQTIPMVALANKHIEVLRFYAHNNDLDDIYGNNLLAISAKYGYNVEHQDGMNIINCDGDTPLHLAIKNKANIDIIKKFMQSGAKYYKKLNHQGETSLHLACAFSSCDVVNLLTTGNNREQDFYLAANNGMRPLDYAIKHKNLKVIDWILQQPYNFKLLEQQVEIGKENYTCKSRTSSLSKDSIISGQNALMLAAVQGLIDVVINLLKLKSDLLEHQDSENNFFFDYAMASFNIDMTHLALMLFSADNILVNKVSKDAIGAMMQVIKTNDLNIFKTILASKYLNIHTTYKNMSLLHYATIYNATKIANFLINRGLDCNLKDNKGNTALHYAVRMNDLKMLDLLLATGNIDVNIANEQEHTAVMLACMLGNVEALLLLYSKGANLDKAFIIAKENSQTQIMQVLDLLYAINNCNRNSNLNITQVLDNRATNLIQKLEASNNFYEKSIIYKVIKTLFNINACGNLTIYHRLAQKDLLLRDLVAEKKWTNYQPLI